MIKKTFYTTLIFCLFIANLGYADYDITFSNTNFLFSQKDLISKRDIVYDYNRFRSDISYYANDDLFKFKLIADLETYSSDSFVDSSSFQPLVDADPNLPFNPYLNLIEEDFSYSRINVYRAYLDIKLDKSTTGLGLQRVPFGVGRLWNPSDMFNPVNALSLETDERQGVFAINHTQHLDDFSSLQVLSSFEKKMELDKYAFRYKTHKLGGDLGLSYVKDSEFYMLGAEFESNILNTGIEFRSEFAFMDRKDLNKRYLNGVIGAEYAFPSMLTVLIEYYYNGKDSSESDLRHYLGSNLSYQLSPLISLRLTTVNNLNDASFYSSPSLNYSISDEGTISLGASFMSGDDGSEFDQYENLYYFKFEMFF